MLITAYPVRGLDINSSMTIYRMLNEQKQKGVAVLFIGEDLDVLLELCDRIMVLCGGKVTGIVHAQAVTKEQLGLMMTGRFDGGGDAKWLSGFPLRVTRRADISTGKAWLVRLCAILLALLTGGVFVAVLGYDPLAVYREMISGSLGSRMSIELTAKLTIPLLITSLGVTLAFKMRFWNIGAEGQICVGAIAATYFALFHDDWPQWILLDRHGAGGHTGRRPVRHDPGLLQVPLRHQRDAADADAQLRGALHHPGAAAGPVARPRRSWAFSRSPASPHRRACRRCWACTPAGSWRWRWWRCSTSTCATPSRAMN